ncbi:HPr family phosphocarrier protein [Kineothrix sedimenti]|uniref:HPr family phosphocarrier protein n=1 Tax=Kineothrix sedimenti TaxID=3123317 RepID=A0ABZ3ES13_9FIRM
MKSFRIRLQSIEEVKKFVSIMAQFNGYFDLISGKYIVDAKSVMGIFSMDLSRTLELRILETNEQESAIRCALEHYIVNE